MEINALIIDDDDASIDVLQSLFSKIGVATTTIDGLSHNITAELETATPVDIVFVDLEMPIMNGYEVLEELLGSPEFEAVPIVAHSIHISHLNEAYDAGFHSFIGKPLNRHTFEEKLQRILSGEQVWEVA